MTDVSLSDALGVHAPGIRNTTSVAGSPLSDIRLEVTGDLSVVEADWRAFEQNASCTPFQSFDWLAAWERNVGAPAGVRPAIITGRRPDGALLFILPLAVERSGFWRTLTFLGHRLCDYNAPLLAPEFPQFVPEADHARWFDSCRRQLRAIPAYGYDLILLDKMPEWIGRQRNPLTPQFTMPHPSGAHSTRLMGDWDGYYASKATGDNRRRDRARRRQLEEQGVVRFHSVEGKSETEATLAILFDYKGRALERMGAPNIFAPSEHRKFFADVAASPHAHVSRLDVGDHCAAVNLGLMFGGCYYHVLTTFDAELRRFAPGAMHLRELLAYAIQHNCARFDFTVGDEPYKLDWSDEQMLLHDHISVASPRGIIAASGGAQWRRVKRAIKQSPRLWPVANRMRRLLSPLRHGGTDGQRPLDDSNG